MWFLQEGSSRFSSQISKCTTVGISTTKSPHITTEPQWWDVADGARLFRLHRSLCELNCSSSRNAGGLTVLIKNSHQMTQLSSQKAFLSKYCAYSAEWFLFLQEWGIYLFSLPRPQNPGSSMHRRRLPYLKFQGTVSALPSQCVPGTWARAWWARHT